MSTHEDFTVTEIWRFPVKSLRGERVTAARVEERGLVGDRLWAVQDEDGKIGSGKNTRRFKRIHGLLDLAARYPDGPPGDGGGFPVVRGRDGRDYPVADGSAERMLRTVSGLPGIRIACDTGVYHFDELPISLIGTASLAWLGEQVPGVAVDARRLRANVVVRTAEPFAEEAWVGRTVRIGPPDGGVEVLVDKVLQRCVMVGMAQDDLTDSSAVLRSIADRETNPLRLAVAGRIARGGVLKSATRSSHRTAGSARVSGRVARGRPGSGGATPGSRARAAARGRRR